MKEFKKYDGIKSGKYIRLNGNESSKNLNEEKLNEILNKVKKLDFNRYPESENTILREEYSKYINLNKDNIIACNGSDEAIALVIGSYISKNKKVLTLNPDFTMYDYYVKMNEGELIKINCRKDGSYEVEDFINFKEKDISLIIFSNPNNPTGYAIGNEDIKKLLEIFNDIPVLVDEAYFEFNGESIVSEVENYKNLLVTRTMSKAFGAASIRVGFLIGCREIINKLNKNKVPYNVNSISQIIGAEILKDKDKLNFTINEVKSERDYLLGEYLELQKENKGRVEVYSSKANYIFGRSREKEFLVKYLKENNILIREFEDDSFRITIGNASENRVVLETIRKYFNIKRGE